MKNYEPGVGMENDAFVGIGSRVCSRNSRIWGLMMVSSGILWSVIQANKAAFFVAIMRAPTTLGGGMFGIAWGDADSSGRVLDS